MRDYVEVLLLTIALKEGLAYEHIIIAAWTAFIAVIVSGPSLCFGFCD